jgi:hypothetical protein
VTVRAEWAGEGIEMLVSHSDTRRFLETKAQTLAARARRLARLTPDGVGIRPQDRPYSPSPAHFAAANRRLGAIDQSVGRRLVELQAMLTQAPPTQVLLSIAMVEREVDRARRAFGLFFEIFSQRGSSFAPALAAHDAIAADCYAAIRQTSPTIFRGPVLKPLTYMEHGYSPATMRRGVTLRRLLGETNPFPVIRIPWDRDNPWQSVFLHEVSHNIQADLGLWQENRDAIARRMSGGIGDPLVTTIFSRWHKEIFADLAAMLLGGTASVWGMMEFLAHPPPAVLTYRPGGAHPIGYLRVPILAEMLRRMGFDDDAARAERIWRDLYGRRRGHRMPARLVQTAGRTIPQVVDEIAYQPRRNLAQRALADVIRFSAADEREIRHAAATLRRGNMPRDLPPRFLLSASRHAVALGGDLHDLSHRVTRHLAKIAAANRAEAAPATLMAA